MRVFLIIICICVYSIAFSASVEDYLLELGKTYWKRGDFKNAEIEFKKVLLINPNNLEAKEYLKKIYQAKKGSLGETKFESIKKEEKRKKKSKFKLRGEYQLSFGIKDKEFIWKRANYDLNEKNWRLLSEDVYNYRENTYDPQILSYLRFNLDYLSQDGLSFYSSFDISPYSFIGKTDEITIRGVGGDSAKIQLKYWANTGYTINETVYTLENGDSFSLPERKVEDNRIKPFKVTSVWGNIFSIPELKIHREFWPIRELAIKYKRENFEIFIFPVALEEKAYTSDDPLTLSNKKIFWEESQWLVKWKPGHEDKGASPSDFFKGWWDDTLAFFTRNSEGLRLTNLRGLSLNFHNNKTNLDFVVSSPKDLWQEYDEFDTLNGITRIKFTNKSNLILGALYGFKLGYNQNSLDAENHVWGLDLNYKLTDNTQLFLEIATSNSKYDETSSYKTKKRGNAFHLSLINSVKKCFGKNYFEIRPSDKRPFYKIKIALTHMDEGFESALSSYRFTRDDTYWSRHLSFREPFQRFFFDLNTPLGWEDVERFKIGDGIDYGRDVINLRCEFFNFLNSKLDGLFDLRNVHSVDGKYIENVTRLELSYKVNKKLLTKFLGIYHDLPKTKAGIDPFIFSPKTGEYYLDWSSDPIDDAKDPSLKTICLGAEYWIFDWLGISGVWEHTNDYTLSYANFPRSLFNSSQPSKIYYENEKRYRDEQPYLYNQEYFPQPPYEWYNIFKIGLKIRPTEKLRIYIDWTRNEFEWVQLTDENMNHTGLEIEYFPLDKLGFYFRYVFSRAKSISELATHNRVIKKSHHNVFLEVKYKAFENDEFILQYGVGKENYLDATFTPYGGGLPALDTQHIVRVYYKKRF